MAEYVEVVGDVLTFDGFDIARISKRVPATTRARFEDAIDKAVLDEAKEAEEAKVATKVLDDALTKIKATAEAGMIDVADVEQVFRELKEVCE